MRSILSAYKRKHEYLVTNTHFQTPTMLMKIKSDVINPASGINTNRLNRYTRYKQVVPRSLYRVLHLAEQKASTFFYKKNVLMFAEFSSNYHTFVDAQLLSLFILFLLLVWCFCYHDWWKSFIFEASRRVGKHEFVRWFDRHCWGGRLIQCNECKEEYADSPRSHNNNRNVTWSMSRALVAFHFNSISNKCCSSSANTTLLGLVVSQW